jgi:GT2 family glycosyltransferase
MVDVKEQIGERPVSVSVVVVNYNGGQAVLDCLQSVQERAEREVEVIVVDNASDDGSPDAIKARFPWVQLIQAGANLGFGAGNNLGVRRARGDYVVFLNPDTLVNEGWLGALMRELKTGGSPNQSGQAAGPDREGHGEEPARSGQGRRHDDPGHAANAEASSHSRPRGKGRGVLGGAPQEIGLVTSKILMADDPGIINTRGNSIHLTGITLCRGLGEPREAMSQTEDVSAASGAAFAMRRDLFERLGGFDEDMFLYMEDTDLSLRAQLAGYKCRYVPDSIVLHRYALKMTPMKVFYQERNRYLMLLKNLRWPTLVVLAPALFSAELIAWAFVALKDRTNAGNKIRAYRWIWSNWKSILRKRAMVQSLRTVPDRAMVRTWRIRLDFGQAASPPQALVGHIAFDPIFALFKLVVLAIVWW